jgi:hypothetical protein
MTQAGSSAEDSKRLGQADDVSEDSMMDDLRQLDIELPAADEMTAEDPQESGSLEDEWARLLEEEAEAHVSEQDQTPSQAQGKQDIS